MYFLRKTSVFIVILAISYIVSPAISSADTNIEPCSPTCPFPTQGVNVNISTAVDTPIAIQLGSNFSTAAAITYRITNDPAEGTLDAFDNTTGSITYTPGSGFSGIDTFTYKSKQGDSSSGTGTVTITVGAVAPADTIAPIITAPAAQYFSTTTIPATPILVAATASDETDPSPVITSDAPTSFPIGTTTITWTATDASGNHSSATSDVGITLVDQYRISGDKSAALTTESFTATALKFDGTNTYVPAAGATVGVVLSSSTTTVATTSIADANGQATFTVATAGSYLIGLSDDLYATTTPITITAPVVPDPAPTPAPVVSSGGGNGPPVASGPVYTAPVAPVVSTPTVSANAPTYVYSDAAASVLTPTPVATITPAPAEDSAPKPKVLAAETQPVATETTPVAQTLPALEQNLAVAQSAAAAAPATDNTTYELLGLVIALLALAGLIWQWKKRREHSQ